MGFSCGAAVLACARLKSRKQQKPPRRQGSNPTAGVSLPDGHCPEGRPSTLRRRFFQLLAVVVIPLLLLGGLEAGLRLGGYGHPTGFFLKTRIGGRAVFVDNQNFGYRFFPRALVRVPEPQVVPAQKSNDTYRVFVFGESAALGDPEPAYGLPRMLELLLRDRFPGARFEVVNAAMTAINSHVILPIARDAARLKGDIWVIYMGNNEVYGPFGAGTVFGPQTPDLSFIRASIAVKKLRVGQLVDSLSTKWNRGSVVPKKWGGMEMFLQQQSRPDEPRRGKVDAHFRENLEAILNEGKKAGVKMVVCTVASNLKDCPPFASLHAAGLSTASAELWNNSYAAGTAAEAQGNFEPALEHYRQAARIDDQFAQLRFRMGRCQLALGRTEEARQDFVAARDLDGLPFRADSKLNGIIRGAAGKRSAEGIYLFDAEESLARQSPDRVCGEDFFHEHVHFTFEGNYLLAESIARNIADLLPRGLAGNSQTNFPSQAECAGQMAFTDWDRYQMFTKLVRRLQEAPFKGQLAHEQREERLRQKLAELEPQTRRAALDAPVEDYRLALTTREDDWVLRDHLAQLLAAAGRLNEAEKEWRRVIELVPHYFVARYQLANLLNGLGRSSEAQQHFLAALQLRPESAEAMNGLGSALAKQGKTEEAVRQFTRALKINPEFADACVNWGLLLARQGKTAEAALKYEQALRLKPDNSVAHVNLGLLLATQKKFDLAAAHYAAALESNPSDANTCFYFGNTLVALDRIPEAREQYARALMLNPNHAEAHLNLGVECAKQNQAEEAFRHFSEAVRIKPDYADAHMNLGLTLAKQRRIAEAIQQFQETLRLDPDNVPAKNFLRAVGASRKSPYPR